MLDQKLAVKLGTSLLFIVGVTLIALNYFSKPKERILSKESLSSSVEKKTVKTLNSKQRKCLNIRETIIKDAKEVSTSPSWTNYYLEKDNKEYVLRIEKDTNSQEKIINRIKFYQLDEDGFPSPFSSFHDQILKDDKQLKELMNGFKLKDTNSVTTQDSYLIEKENDKIVLIKDQSKNEACDYTSQE